MNRNGYNLLVERMIFDEKIRKFISNSCYYRKFYFLQVTSLHSKFYGPKREIWRKMCPKLYLMLKLTGIATTTLWSLFLISCRKEHLSRWMHVIGQNLHFSFSRYVIECILSAFQGVMETPKHQSYDCENKAIHWHSIFPPYI